MICAAARPGTLRKAFELMRSDPRPQENARHTRLRGDLATQMMDRRALERWQIEVTGAGWIWYLIDDDRRTVWVMQASTGHPKATELKRPHTCQAIYGSRSQAPAPARRPLNHEMR